MVRPTTEIPKHWIGLLQEKHGWDADYFRYLSDIFFAHYWVIKNVRQIEDKNGEALLVFNINKLHKSSRFKDSKRERVTMALNALIHWQICSEPFKLITGRWRPQLVCRVESNYLPETDSDIETIHNSWLQGWYSRAAS